MPTGINGNLLFGIAGAGIAGLATAISLRQRGRRAVIFEKTPEFRPAGAGIGITPNGMHMLDTLGVGDAVRTSGVHLDTMELRTSRGRLLHRMDLLALEKVLGAPFIAIHRAALHQALIDALPSDMVQTGSEVKEISETAEGITVRLTGGSEHRVGALIGADGIHSRVRELLHGPEALRYAGYAAWRGVSETSHEAVREGCGIQVWDRGVRFGAVSVGAGRTYWWLAAKASEQDGPTQDDLKLSALRLCADWKSLAADLVNATPADSILWLGIYDRPVRWGKGAVTLVGDSAHPMTPNLVQGASQALEDAVALGRYCTDANTSAEAKDAFRMFENSRAKRVSRMVTMSRRAGRIGQLESLPAVWLRNTFTRLAPDFIARRQVASLMR